MNFICTKNIERLKQTINSTKKPIIEIEFVVEEGDVVPNVCCFEIVQSKSKIEDEVLISAFRLKARLMRGYPGEKNEYLFPYKLEEAYFISDIFNKNPEILNEVKIKNTNFTKFIFSDFYSFEFKSYKGGYFFKFKHTAKIEKVNHLIQMKNNPYMDIEI